MTGWGTPAIVALYTGRPVATIRQWAYGLRIPVACELQTRRLIVHAGEARRYSLTRGDRQRAALKA